MADEKLKIQIQTEGAQTSANQFHNVSQAAGELSSALNSVGLSSIAGAASLLGMANVLKNTVGGWIAAAREMGKYKTILTTVYKDANIAASELNKTIEQAKKLPFDVMGIVESTKQLTVFGQNAQHWIPLVADLAAGMGTSIEETAGGISKALAGSQFALRTLRDQFGVTGARLKEFGATVDQNNSIILRGEKNLNAFKTALEKYIEANFKGLAEQMTKGVRGAVVNFGDAIERLKAKLGEALLPAFAALLRTMTKVIEFFEQLPKPILEIISWGAVLSGTVVTLSLAFTGLSKILPIVIDLMNSSMISFTRIAGVINTVWLGMIELTKNSLILNNALIYLKADVMKLGTQLQNIGPIAVGGLVLILTYTKLLPAAFDSLNNVIEQNEGTWKSWTANVTKYILAVVTGPLGALVLATNSLERWNKKAEESQAIQKRALKAIQESYTELSGHTVEELSRMGVSSDIVRKRIEELKKGMVEAMKGPPKMGFFEKMATGGEIVTVNKKLIADTYKTVILENEKALKVLTDYEDKWKDLSAAVNSFSTDVQALRDIKFFGNAGEEFDYILQKVSDKGIIEKINAIGEAGEKSLDLALTSFKGSTKEVDAFKMALGKPLKLGKLENLDDYKKALLDVAEKISLLRQATAKAPNDESGKLLEQEAKQYEEQYKIIKEVIDSGVRAEEETLKKRFENGRKMIEFGKSSWKQYIDTLKSALTEEKLTGQDRAKIEEEIKKAKEDSLKDQISAYEGYIEHYSSIGKLSLEDQKRLWEAELQSANLTADKRIEIKRKVESIEYDINKKSWQSNEETISKQLEAVGRLKEGQIAAYDAILKKIDQWQKAGKITKEGGKDLREKTEEDRLKQLEKDTKESYEKQKKIVEDSYADIDTYSKDSLEERLKYHDQALAKWKEIQKKYPEFAKEAADNIKKIQRDQYNDEKTLMERNYSRWKELQGLKRDERNLEIKDLERQVEEGKGSSTELVNKYKDDVKQSEEEITAKRTEYQKQGLSEEEIAVRESYDKRLLYLSQKQEALSQKDKYAEAAAEQKKTIDELEKKGNLTPEEEKTQKLAEEKFKLFKDLADSFDSLANDMASKADDYKNKLDKARKALEAVSPKEAKTTGKETAGKTEEIKTTGKGQGPEVKKETSEIKAPAGPTQETTPEGIFAGAVNIFQQAVNTFSSVLSGGVQKTSVGRTQAGTGQINITVNIKPGEANKAGVTAQKTNEGIQIKIPSSILAGAQAEQKPTGAAQVGGLFGNLFQTGLSEA